jgi:hypothetical protein
MIPLGERFKQLPVASKVLLILLGLPFFIGALLLASLIAYFALGLVGLLGEPDGSDFYVALGLVFVTMVVGGIVAYLVRDLRFVAQWRERHRVSRQTRAAEIENLHAFMRQARESGVKVPLPPEKALDRVVEKMTREGWGLTNLSGTTATFSRDEGADCFLGCFLTILFVVPGLLYLYLYNKTSRLTVAVYPSEEGSRLIIGGDNRGVVEELMIWARTMPNEDNRTT